MLELSSQPSNSRDWLCPLSHVARSPSWAHDATFSLCLGGVVSEWSTSNIKRLTRIFANSRFLTFRFSPPGCVVGDWTPATWCSEMGQRSKRGLDLKTLTCVLDNIGHIHTDLLEVWVWLKAWTPWGSLLPVAQVKSSLERRFWAQWQRNVLGMHKAPFRPQHQRQTRKTKMPENCSN